LVLYISLRDHLFSRKDREEKLLCRNFFILRRETQRIHLYEKYLLLNNLQVFLMAGQIFRIFFRLSALNAAYPDWSLSK
jgi:hypothetical protein